MSSFKTLTALAFLSLATTAFACDGVWVPSTAGDWSTGFSPCIPMTAGDTATFGIPPRGPVAVNLDISPSVTALNFQKGNPYTLSGAGTITVLGVGAGDPSFVNVTQGDHAINCGIALNNNTVFTANINAGASINLSTQLSDGAVSSMVVNGPGETNFLATSTTSTVGAIINGDLTVQNNGNLTFDNSIPSLVSINSFLETNTGNALINNGTLTLSNSGVVQNSGVGQVVGTGWQSVTGSVTLNQGILNFINTGDISSSSVTSQALGVLALVNDFIMNGGNLNLFNSGSITTFSGSNFTCVGSGLVAGGQMTMNGGTILINNTGKLDANTLLGCGLVAFSTNPILINGGTLINNGVVLSATSYPTPGIIVAPQGTIAGDGLYSGLTMGFTAFAPTTVINNGTAIPGTPDPIPGTMTILGNYQQNSSGTLLSNISNINSYGQISVIDFAGVGGTATIAGSLDLYGVSGIKVKPGDAFKVVTTTNGLTGTFSSVNMLNTPYIPMVFYFPNFVEVILNAGTYPALYQSVFASINHKNIRLEREMQNLHKRFAGEQAVPKEVARNRMFSSRQGPILATVNLGSIQTERRQERLHREMEICNNTPWNVYFGPIGSVGEVHRKGFNAGFDEWSAGALAGFDYAFEEVGVGLLAEYERLHGDVHRNWGKFNIDQAHASFYATYVPQSVPEFAVNGIIGGGYEGSHIRRNTGMTGKSVAQGNPSGWEFDGLFGLEYAVTSKQVQEFSDNFRFTPMVNLQYVYVHFPKYKEHGAGIFDLSMSHLNGQSLRSTLGAWFNYLWQWTDLSINLEADVGWQREYFDRGSSIKFAGVSSSTLKTRGAGRNTCLAGLDLLFTLYKTYGIEASYDFEWNKMFHDHSFYVGFNIEF